MKPSDPQGQETESETVEKLKNAYMQDEGLPEEIAAARAKAEVNRLAGRTDDAFGAAPDVREKKGGFSNDGNQDLA